VIILPLKILDVVNRKIQANPPTMQRKRPPPSPKGTESEPTFCRIDYKRALTKPDFVRDNLYTTRKKHAYREELSTLLFKEGN
jgi:hypothetical protein